MRNLQIDNFDLVSFIKLVTVYQGGSYVFEGGKGVHDFDVL